MFFDLQVLETLLHLEESSSLDFKEEQYNFVNSDKGEKAELLKDILAFANSWRLSEAYLLIGVREVKGGRSELVGVNHHLDDANLHQFVNSKTQRPIEFRYLPFRAEGVEIGVIEIPFQERPICLTSRYGKLRPNEVWIRDGSSSRLATPDEIANMGAARVIPDIPGFNLDWANLDERSVFPSDNILSSRYLYPVLPPETFVPITPAGVFSEPSYNQHYSRDLIFCTLERNLVSPLGFRLQNVSGTVGRRVRFIGQVSKSTGLVIQEGINDIPALMRNSMLAERTFLNFANPDEGKISLMEFKNRWQIEIDFGDVRPRNEVWTGEALYFGSTTPTELTLQGELRGDNIAVPIDCKLSISFEVERRPMQTDDVLPFMRS